MQMVVLWQHSLCRQCAETRHSVSLNAHGCPADLYKGYVAPPWQKGPAWSPVMQAPGPQPKSQSYRAVVQHSALLHTAPEVLVSLQNQNFKPWHAETVARGTSTVWCMLLQPLAAGFHKAAESMCHVLPVVANYSHASTTISFNTKC